MLQQNTLPLVGTPDSVAAPSEDHERGASDALRLGQMLVEMGKLSPRGLKRGLRLQARQPSRFGLLRKDNQSLRLGEALLKLKLVTEEDLRRALSRQFSFPCLESRSDTGLSHELVSAYRPFDAAAEAFRTLRSQLLLRWFDGERRTLAIVSPGKGEGRSYVAANLAVVFSQMGKRTLLVDADLRRPRQDLIFNLPRHYGLSGVLGMPRNVQEVVRVPGLGDLSVVSAGPIPPNPLELLSQTQFKRWLGAKAEQFEVILIDTPASTPYMDTAVITAQSAGALMVVRKNHTRLSLAQEVADSLASSGVPVVGTVLNRF